MITTSAKVKWGIVSTGRIANWFATDFPWVEKAELHSVCSRSLANAGAFADQYGIANRFDSLNAMLTDPLLDVVYIGTPHTDHISTATKALQAGKAVLCEKPLVVSVEECKRLIDVQQSTGCYLMEAMWTWFLPAIRVARQWVREGRIGAIKHIKADFGYPLPYSPDQREYDVRQGGGALLEMGIYPVALTWLFRQEHPGSIHVAGKQAPNGAYDDLVITMDYGDMVASLATSFRCKLQNWAYIIGDKGYIAIPDFWRANECFLYQLDDCVDHYQDTRQSQGFHFEAQAVTDDVLAGRNQSATMPLSASLAFQKLMADIMAAC